MFKKTTAQLLSIVLCLLLSGCGASSRVVFQDDFSPPQSLVVYTSHPEELFRPIIKEFEERTGIWVTVHTGGSTEIFERVVAEESAPQADIIFGGSADVHQQYSQWLTPYTADGIHNINDSFYLPDHLATPFSLLPVVIAYNSSLVTGKEAPTKWQDLLSPVWKGEIAFADPSTSASCYTSLCTLAQAADDTPWENITLFANNIDNQLLESSTQTAASIVDGRFKVGVTLEENAFTLQKQGKEISFIYPAEGTTIIVDATSLVKGAPHSENAKKFIDFTICNNVQTMLSQEHSRRPVCLDIAAPPELLPLQQIPLFSYDQAWSITHYKEVLLCWEREF